MKREMLESCRKISKDINKVRLKIFNKKLSRNRKATDISTLPPCRQVLQYHAWRANAIASIWQHSTSSIIELPKLEDNGSTSEEKIYWMDDAFPDDVEDLLFNEEDEDEDEEDGQYFCGNDTESSDEEEWLSNPLHIIIFWLCY